MNFHPLANIFPLIDGQAYSDLVADIIKHGVREPVWLYEGQILDGRNRWRAAEAANAECPTREYAGAEPIAFVWSLNATRRHLTREQLAISLAKSREFLAHGGDRRSAEFKSSIGALNAAQEASGISDKTLERAREVIRGGTPELVAAVERGDVAVSAAAQFVALPDEAREPALEEIIATPEAAKEIVKQAVKAHVANNSGNNEWYTPSDYIEAARSVMGSIDTDPASSKVANKAVDARKFFTAEQNGLAQKWSGNVWMNPPYAQPLISEFASALVEKYNSGEIDQACVLVNNATDTAWFRALAESSSATCFTKGRIRFIDPEGKPSGAPLQGQAVLYFGGKAKAFAEAFKGLGYTFVGMPVGFSA